MATKISLWDSHILKSAIRDSFLKLSLKQQIRNPVMFPVYIGSILTTGIFLASLFVASDAPIIFILSITLWLWFTLLFANFCGSYGRRSWKSTRIGIPCC